MKQKEAGMDHELETSAILLNNAENFPGVVDVHINHVHFTWNIHATKPHKWDGLRYMIFLWLHRRLLLFARQCYAQDWCSAAQGLTSQRCWISLNAAGACVEGIYSGPVASFLDRAKFRMPKLRSSVLSWRAFPVRLTPDWLVPLIPSPAFGSHFYLYSHQVRLLFMTPP